MEIVYARVAAVDLHKKQITVAVRTPGGTGPGERRQQVRAAGSRDPATVLAATEEWLLGQDWAAVLRRVPAGVDETFLVSHAGHVGLAVAPPFTDQRTLAIFDPMQ